MLFQGGKRMIITERDIKEDKERVILAILNELFGHEARIAKLERERNVGQAVTIDHIPNPLPIPDNELDFRSLAERIDEEETIPNKMPPAFVDEPAEPDFGDMYD